MSSVMRGCFCVVEGMMSRRHHTLGLFLGYLPPRRERWRGVVGDGDGALWLWLWLGVVWYVYTDNRVLQLIDRRIFVV